MGVNLMFLNKKVKESDRDVSIQLSVLHVFLPQTFPFVLVAVGKLNRTCYFQLEQKIILLPILNCIILQALPF